ncbi:MAG TPA: hypothetical protein VFC80_04540 [Sphaerochaeta sp.]|nr:hypothetical protein [Sphaerochaeta sp.]
MRKKISMFVLMLLVASLLTAQVSYKGGAKITLAYGSSFDAKADASFTVKLPLLQGDGPLFSGNNLAVTTTLAASPIAATASVNAVLTPIAVAEVNLGAAVGTGWDFPPFGLEGLRLGSPLVSDQLKGAYYRARAGVALQFDTGVIFSSPWAGVLLRSYHELNYSGYTGAQAGEMWEFEIGGAMVNGFAYFGTHVIGYKIPWHVNLVGVQAETYLYDIFGTKSDLFVDLSLLANTQVTDSIGVLVVGQFTNFKKDAASVLQKRDALGFKRVAVITSFSF